MCQNKTLVNALPHIERMKQIQFPGFKNAPNSSQNACGWVGTKQMISRNTIKNAKVMSRGQKMPCRKRRATAEDDHQATVFRETRKGHDLDRMWLLVDRRWRTNSHTGFLQAKRLITRLGKIGLQI